MSAATAAVMTRGGRRRTGAALGAGAVMAVAMALAGCEQAMLGGPDTSSPYDGLTVGGGSNVLAGGGRVGVARPDVQRPSAVCNAPTYGAPAGAARQALWTGQPVQESFSHIENRRIETGARFLRMDVNEFLRVSFNDILRYPFVAIGRLNGTVDFEIGEGLDLTRWLNLIDAEVRKAQGALQLDRGVFVVSPKEGSAAGSHTNIGTIPLTYANAGDLAEVLAKIFPDVRIVPAEKSSALVVLDFMRLGYFWEINDMAKSFDRGALNNKSLFLYRLKEAKADDVAQELTRIYEDNHRRGVNSAPAPSFANFLPISRINAVLAVVNPGFDMSRIDNLVVGLDEMSAADAETRRVRTVKLRSRRAQDIVALMTVMLGPSGVPVQTGLPRALAPVTAGDQTAGGNSQGGGQQAANHQTGADGATLANGAPPILPDANSPAGQRIAALAGRIGESVGKESSVRFAADTGLNTILLSGPPSATAAVVDMIRELDAEEVRQVYIETAIVEVRASNEFRFGMQGIIEAGKATIIPFASGANPSAAFPGMGLVLNNNSVHGVLNMLDSVSDVRVLATPRVMVMNNQEAELKVGDDVPVLVRQSTSTSTADAAVVNSVDYRETGILIKLQPTILSDNSVALSLSQELSSAGGGSNEAASLTPTISKRQLRTSLHIDSGETAVLGGLVQTNREKSRDRPPVPWLGDLFQSTSRSGDQRELLLLVHPLVVNNREQRSAITTEIKARMDAAWGMGLPKTNIFEFDGGAQSASGADGADRTDGKDAKGAKGGNGKNGETAKPAPLRTSARAP